MATITQSNYDNYLTWQKVNGTLTLTALQRDGMPGYIEDATPAPSYSAEALAAFALYDSLGDGLTPSEKSVMADYIDAEVALGNHAKKDYETIYSLSGANALVDYIGGKVATAVNAPTQNINGFTLDGSTQYILMGVDLSLLTNYSQNDAYKEGFLYDWVFKTAENYLIKEVSGSVLQRISFRAGAGTRIRNYTNTSTSGGIYAFEPVNKTLYATGRDGATSSDLYKDGVSVLADTTTSAAILSTDLYVGWICPCTVSSALLGSSIGFDKSGHNTNLRALLTGLGVIL